MRLSCNFFDKDEQKIGTDEDRKSGHIMLMRKTLQSACWDLEWQVMNEVALHRGSSPHLNTIDIFVDGQHLTEAVVYSITILMAGIILKAVFF